MGTGFDVLAMCKPLGSATNHVMQFVIYKLVYFAVHLCKIFSFIYRFIGSYINVEYNYTTNVGLIAVPLEIVPPSHQCAKFLPWNISFCIGRLLRYEHTANIWKTHVHCCIFLKEGFQCWTFLSLFNYFQTTQISLPRYRTWPLLNDEIEHPWNICDWYGMPTGNACLPDTWFRPLLGLAAYALIVETNLSWFSQLFPVRASNNFEMFYPLSIDDAVTILNMPLTI